MQRASSSLQHGNVEKTEPTRLIITRGRRPCHIFTKGTLRVCLPTIPASPRDTVVALACRLPVKRQAAWIILGTIVGLAQAWMSGILSLTLMLVFAIVAVMGEYVIGRRRGRGFDCKNRIYPDWVMEALNRTSTILSSCKPSPPCSGTIVLGGRLVAYRVPGGWKARLSGRLVEYRLVEGRL